MVRTSRGPSRVESASDRHALAADAGYPRLSLPSVFAGTFAAFGFVALLGGTAVAIAGGTGVSTQILTAPASGRTAVVGAAVAVVVMFVGYMYGGYVAGRMARRSGILNGFGVFVLALILLAVAGAIVAAFTSPSTLTSGLRNTVVLPASMRNWGAVGTIAVVVSVAAMLLGAVLGGRLGEAWHGKLVARALNPEYGTEAGLRDRSQENLTRAGVRGTAARQRVETGTAGHAVPPERASTEDEPDLDVRDIEVRGEHDAAPERDRGGRPSAV